jgi:hypothetical protein
VRATVNRPVDVGGVFQETSSQGSSLKHLGGTVSSRRSPWGASSRGGAQARTSESFQFSDPLTGNYDCAAFTVTISGQDKGHVKTWFDADGNPIMQVRHIKANEVDTNDATGKAILIRTDLAVHIDFVAGTIASVARGTFQRKPAPALSSNTWGTT